MSLVNKRCRIKNSVLLCVTLWLIILLFSCQSTPKGSDSFSDEAQFLPLNTGASVYIFANVQEARSILELLPIEELKDKQVKKMLDRTGFAAAAFFPEDSGQRFQLASWGNYPRNADIAFALNKNWKKHNSPKGQKYWHSSADKLSIALTSRQAFITASLNDAPVSPYAASSSSLHAGIEIPEGFNAFRGVNNNRAPLSFWLENPGSLFSNVMNEAGIPIRFPVQQFFLNLNNAANGQYEATIRLQFDNISQARGITAILSLASGFDLKQQPNQSQYMKIAALLLANPPVQNGRNVDIKTGAMNKDEIMSIFNIFMSF